jgi:hypothetical protein
MCIRECIYTCDTSVGMSSNSGRESSSFMHVCVCARPGVCMSVCVFCVCMFVCVYAHRYMPCGVKQFDFMCIHASVCVCV